MVAGRSQRGVGAGEAAGGTEEAVMRLSRRGPRIGVIVRRGGGGAPPK